MSQPTTPELPTPLVRSLSETQLCLYFAVGPVRDESDATNSELQSKSFAALEAIFVERGMAELGKGDLSFAPELRFLPIELCACEWDSIEVDGDAVYSMCFYSGAPIEQDAALKLRAMALEAYTQVCGADARFIRAELFEKWSVSGYRSFTFEN